MSRKTEEHSKEGRHKDEGAITQVSAGKGRACHTTGSEQTGVCSTTQKLVSGDGGERTTIFCPCACAHLAPEKLDGCEHHKAGRVRCTASLSYEVCGQS